LLNVHQRFLVRDVVPSLVHLLLDRVQLIPNIPELPGEFRYAGALSFVPERERRF
jgi:hypothetical protein